MSVYESSGYIGVALLAIVAGFVLQAFLWPTPLDGGWDFYEIIGFAVAGVTGLVWLIDDSRKRRQ